MTADRYDDRAAREAWQRLLRPSSAPRRVPTAAADELAQLSVALADSMAQGLLVRRIATARLRGWEPAEIEHAVATRTGPGGGRLARAAIDAERPGADDDPARAGWLRRWRSEEGLDRPLCHDLVAEVWRVLDRLPRLPVPGAGATGMARVLLAPAWVEAAAVLLTVVARAYGCRAIVIGELGVSAVVGRPGDLAVVERLFASLLAQVDDALAVVVDGDRARARSPAFALAFRLGFAARVRERLPALGAVPTSYDGASRAGAVDREVARVFGERLRHRRTGGRLDPAGLALGRAAAERVRLDPNAGGRSR